MRGCETDYAYCTYLTWVDFFSVLLAGDDVGALTREAQPLQRVDLVAGLFSKHQRTSICLVNAAKGGRPSMGTLSANKRPVQAWLRFTLWGIEFCAGTTPASAGAGRAVRMGSPGAQVLCLLASVLKIPKPALLLDCLTDLLVQVSRCGGWQPVIRVCAWYLGQGKSDTSLRCSCLLQGIPCARRLVFSRYWPPFLQPFGSSA